MTIEEKVVHIQEVAMTEARSEGNQILETHQKALDSLYVKHTTEARKQMTTKINAETVRARQQLNQTTAKAQVELKRALGKRQIFLKDKLFVEVRTLLQDYMQTDAYCALLRTHITNAAKFANKEPLTIYLNPSDVARKAELEVAIGLKLTISREDFIGGIRATIPSRNILIDHSFLGMLDTQYDHFQFLGGANID